MPCRPLESDRGSLKGAERVARAYGAKGEIREIREVSEVSGNALTY